MSMIDVDDQPTIEAEPVWHGMFKQTNNLSFRKCSICGAYVTVTSDYETVIVYTTDLNEEDFIKNITSAETDYGDRLDYSFKDLNIFQVLGFDKPNEF